MTAVPLRRSGRLRPDGAAFAGCSGAGRKAGGPGPGEGAPVSAGAGPAHGDGAVWSPGGACQRLFAHTLKSSMPSPADAGAVMDAV